MILVDLDYTNSIMIFVELIFIAYVNNYDWYQQLLQVYIYICSPQCPKHNIGTIYLLTENLMSLTHNNSSSTWTFCPIPQKMQLHVIQYKVHGLESSGVTYAWYLWGKFSISNMPLCSILLHGSFTIQVCVTTYTLFGHMLTHSHFPLPFSCVIVFGCWRCLYRCRDWHLSHRSGMLIKMTKLCHCYYHCPSTV